MSNFKLPLVLIALAGSAFSQAQSALSSGTQHPLPAIQNARVLIVFAPAADSAAYRTQLQLLERHSFELSMHNTVVVPVASDASAHFAFEHVALANADDQAAARTRFHIAPGEFAVVLVNPDGSEQIHSAKPIDIRTLVSSLDALELMGPLTASLY